MKWAGLVTCVRENKNVYILVGKHVKKERFGMCNCRWKDSIKMDLTEIGCVGMDWLSVARGGDKTFQYHMMQEFSGLSEDLLAYQRVFSLEFFSRSYTYIEFDVFLTVHHSIDFSNLPT